MEKHNTNVPIAEIIRDKNSKKISLIINANDNWKLFAGSSVKSIDKRNHISQGNSKGVFPINMQSEQRHYFLLETPDEQIFITDRLLPMAGAHNLRDLGGVRTTEGKIVKWGKLFRAGELSTLTDEDITYLNSIPIKTIVDFRDYSEKDKEPDIHPDTLENNYHFALFPGNLSNNVDLKLDDLTAEHALEIMKEMYSELVSDPKCVSCYQQFFEIIQDEKKLPLIFHCTAGKDRTGIAAALIYIALGVDIEYIIYDYLLSNEHLEEKYGWIKQKSEFFRVMMEVTPELLYNTFDIITKKHGSVEDFLTAVLKVDIDKMRKIYLY